ncbi:MAG: aldo/keto reductase [Treponema sp.]|jgi:predicted aldo/keto reductase-like oxidoreductase|nr:aldo/keto reductase [Treponema sp.]
MQYRIDKRTGNQLSVLGFGCMRFPKSLGVIDMRKTEELVMRSIAGGVNYFDTAWIYPGSEETLGSILEKNKAREKVYIATKLPLVMLKSPADFDRYFFQGLKRLRTSYIDYYLLHMITDMDQWTKLKEWGIEEWIAEKKKTGQIRQTGFSYHGSSTEFLKVIDDYDWEMCQIQYNYSDENFQAGVTGLRRASTKMSVMIMEPLLGGRLAGGLPKDALEVFKKANPAVSPAGWGLNWVWNQEEVTLLLSGMNDMAQLEENLRLANIAKPGMLSETDLGAYQQALEVLNRAYKIRCTGCNYCMPCPRGVNIPGCFSAYNTSFAIGYITGLKHFVTSTALTSERSSSPALCIKCGKCETHCPQHLPIMHNLAVVQRKMEPFWLRFAGVCARAFLGKKRKKKQG